MLPFAPLPGALAASLTYWPGLVTWDSLRQYDQALSGDFDDWHPPVMEWVWRQLLPLAHGPAPMLLLQLALYAAGFALVIGAVARRRGFGPALAIGCVALLPVPVALMATIIKDSLMTGALLLATGLCLRADATPRASAVSRAAALLLCVFVATLRFNAFLAVLPIAWWALPPGWRATPRRAITGALLLLALLLAAMPVANRLLHARASDVQLSLVIFDLGGITEHAGVNQFPPLGVADPVAVNHRCYTPVKWDSYSWWADPLCPIGFEAVRRDFAARAIDPRGWWLSAIAHHPLAWAAHRLTHWSIGARFLTSDDVDRPVQVEAPPNDWGFAITPNPAVRAVDRMARWSAHTPLGWPCVWMAAMIGLLWAGGGRIDAGTRVIAWSALLYGLGYGAFGVAAELRYYLWTMVAGAIALVLGVTELPRGAWMRLIAPPVLVALPAIGYRLLYG